MKKAIWLLVALVLGIVVGGFLHRYAEIAWVNTLIVNWVGMVGQVFLRLIFMIVVPLVVSALLLGTYELASSRGMGRVLEEEGLPPKEEAHGAASPRAFAISRTLKRIIET